MKARSLARRPAAARRPARAPLAKAARPLRSAHERQAEDVGARFMGGETGLGRHLTPAPAACFHLPASSPQALSAGLRGPFERSFNADLGGLRVHTDAPAAGAARLLGARAFTAGSSIYFGPGAWSPHSRTGRELLAHEIAHALQQAGRASLQGRQRLEPMAQGVAGVQRQPDPDEKARAARHKANAIAASFKAGELWQPSKDSKGCTETIDRHLKALPDDALIQKYGEQIKKAVDGQSIEDAVTAVDDALAKAPDDDKTKSVKALFFDTYKSLNADSKAKDVVGKELPEQTAFGSWSFYDSQRRGDASWVSGVLRMHPVAREYYLSGILAVARIDFYGPGRGALNLDVNMKFDEKMGKAITDATTYGPLIPDERTAVALRALVVFDAIRQAAFQDLAKENQKAKSLLMRFIHKFNFTQQYAAPDFIPNLAANNTADPEVLAIATEVGAAVAPIAQRAIIYWKQVMELAKGAVSQDTDEDVQRRAGKLQDLIRKKLRTMKPLASVEKRLIAILGQAARLSSGGVPSPAELAANLGTAAYSVQQLVFQLDGLLASRDKSLKVTEVPPATASAGDDPLAADAVSDDMVYGFVLYLLFVMHETLSNYAAPPRKKETGDRIRDQDEALAYLRKTARGFRNLGTILGYADLEKAAGTIVDADQAGLTKSYVALLAPFEKVDSTLKDFQRDFPTGEFAQGGLSGASFVQAVFALYYQNLLGKLTTALKEVMPSGKTHEFDYSLDNKAIVDTALDAVNSTMHMPRKYRVPKDSTILYVRAADAHKVFDFISAQNREVADLVATEIGKNEKGFVPGEYNSHVEGFVVWVLPDIDLLVGQLATIPGLDKLRRDDGKELGPPSAYETPMAWLDALNKAAAKDAATRQVLRDAIKAWLDKAIADLDMPLRRATNNERGKVRPLVEAQWERLTKRFLDAPNDYFEAPKLALRNMLTFVGNIEPQRLSEQMLQMTGLLLEIAPVLSRKLGESTSFGELVHISGTDRLDIVLPLHAHVAGAARFAADPQNLKDLQTLNLAFPITDLDRRTKLLKGLAEGFQKTAEEHQAQMEMEGVQSDNMLRIPDRGHALVAKKGGQGDDDIFIIGGVVYQLVQVHRNFKYQPELLAMASGIKWGADDISNRKLWVDGKPYAVAEPEIPLVSIIRTPDKGQPVEMVVTSNNVSMLSELAYGLDLHITLENLSTLATVLEGYAQVLTTAIQIAFPEFATEIAAAEIAGSVVQFLGSPEFAMLRAALDSDSGNLFNKGLSAITDQLTLDALWDYLLFDITPPMFATLRQVVGLMGRMGKFKKSDDHEKTKSAVMKVFGRLIKVAAEIIGALEFVHDDVSFPFRKMSLYAQGSPWLSLLLRFVANNLYRLEGMTLAELGVEQATDMISEVQQMYLRFETVVAGLGEYELPKELVPVPAILDMLVNFLIDHLPIKYRLIVREAKRDLQKLFDWLYEKADKALKDNNLDPNQLWRDYIAKEVDPYIQRAGKEVSEEIEKVLKRVPFLHDLATIDVKKAVTQFVDRDVEPAALPKLQAGTTRPLGPATLPQEPGAPMASGAKSEAQRGFGHDFSHVRIHRSGTVDSSLRSSGARAATAGSHVYLDSGISTDTPGGRDVLHHELAHVLQQSGARPLGRRHSDAPMRGVTGSGERRSGWDINPAAERQADRLAHASRIPAAAPRSVTPARGLQPSLFDLVAKVFGELGDPKKLHENVEQLGARPVRAKELGQAAPGLKDSIADKLFAAMIPPGKPGSVVSYAAPFDAAGDDLLDYVLNNRKKDIESGLPHVLDAGLDEIKPKDKDPFWILVPGRVETELEEFFFGKTGVSVDIEFNIKKVAGPDEKERKAIDPDKPFAKIKFNYVHLPMLGGTAALWKNVIQHSFPKAGTKTPLYQANARLVLLGLRLGPGLFTTGKDEHGAKVLIFSRKVRDLIEAYVNPPPGRTVPGDVTPKWDDYIKPDGTASKDYGQIGLRLGLYKNRTKGGQQEGRDRASHHTVQYLLLEYLVNTKDRVKPFPNDLSLYPNLIHTGQRVDVISKVAKGNSGINISANESDRGGEMPTILLSVHAHTYGNVHISPKADDIEGTPPSQGSAIHGEFKKYLGEYQPIVQGKAAPLQQMADKAAGKPPKKGDPPLPMVGGAEATQEDMSTAIFNAACKTYTWMRDHMNTKLQDALDDQEVAYYNKLVETATLPDIYDKTAGKAKPDYTPGGKIGPTIIANVKSRQKDVFQSTAFGFEEMTP